MKRLTSLSIAAFLAAIILPSSVLGAPRIFVKILPSSGPRVLAVNKTFTLHLAVRGIKLDPRHIGKRAIKGHGHIQIYLDRIPSDAYRKADAGYLSAVAATTFAIQPASGLVRSLAKGSHHRIIVALARNDYVLYRAKPASMIVTVK